MSDNYSLIIKNGSCFIDGKLEKIDIALSGNKIKEITGLKNLKNLSYLYLDKNAIEDVAGLEGLLECPTINVVNKKFIKTY